MTAILSLISGWWTEILAGIAVIAALVSSYYGGKKIGTAETQAKADVTAAEKDKMQAEAVAKRQNENTEIAKNVQSINSGISDDAARRRLQQSKYNSAD